MPMTFSHGCLLAEEHGEAGWLAPVSCSSHLGFCVISKWSFFSGCPQLHSQPSQPNIPGLTSRLTIPFTRKRERDSFRKRLVWRLSSLALRNLLSGEFYLAAGSRTGNDSQGWIHPSAWRMQVRKMVLEMILTNISLSIFHGALIWANFKDLKSKTFCGQMSLGIPELKSARCVTLQQDSSELWIC